MVSIAVISLFHVLHLIHVPILLLSSFKIHHHVRLNAVITGLSLFGAMKKRLQTYIQENTPLLQQRHGLVTMLPMASQTKDKDGNYLIASEVTAIAEFLIIMDLEKCRRNLCWPKLYSSTNMMIFREIK